MANQYHLTIRLQTKLTYIKVITGVVLDLRSYGNLKVLGRRQLRLGISRFP